MEKRANVEDTDLSLSSDRSGLPEGNEHIFIPFDLRKHMRDDWISYFS